MAELLTRMPQRKPAQTFSEWWQPQYAREHFVVGVLVGFLLGALISLSLNTLEVTLRPLDRAEAIVLNSTSSGLPS